MGATRHSVGGGKIQAAKEITPMTNGVDGDQLPAGFLQPVLAKPPVQRV
jgi:hypothetical protein